MFSWFWRVADLFKEWPHKLLFIVYHLFRACQVRAGCLG